MIVKVQDEENIVKAAILLFYIQWRHYLKEAAFFSNNYDHTLI